MVLHAPEIAATARPGQFVMVYLERGDLLLPRPISICDADAGAGTVEIVYQVVGKGTAALAQITAGHVNILGAQGNGFDTEGMSPGTVAIVGGGIGTPPLLFLAKKLAEAGISADVFLGFRDAPILVERFREVVEPLGGKVRVASESGSHGIRGYVTELFTINAQTENYTKVFACGPAPMLRALAEISRAESIPCQVSVEERMACGLGTCVGCVVQVGGNYVRVCTEGPVFDALDLYG